MENPGRYLLGNNVLGSLGDSALGNLEALFHLFLYGLLLLLNGGGESPGAAGKVAGKIGVGREARGVLSNEVIESSFEVALLEVLVAAGGWLAGGLEEGARAVAAHEALGVDRVWAWVKLVATTRQGVSSAVHSRTVTGAAGGRHGGLAEAVQAGARPKGASQSQGDDNTPGKPWGWAP